MVMVSLILVVMVIKPHFDGHGISLILLVMDGGVLLMVIMVNLILMVMVSLILMVIVNIWWSY